MSRSTQHKTRVAKTIVSRQTILQFGKYKGKTIEFVLEHNPQYLLFCQEQIEWFDLDSSIMDEVEGVDESERELRDLEKCWENED